MRKPIRILTLELSLVGEVDNYSSLIFDMSWHGIGEFELRINKYIQYADELQKDRLIIIGNDYRKVFVIKYRQIELDENGKASENWIVRGLQLKSIVAERLTIPPTGKSHDNVTGSHETVMKHYIDTCLVNTTDIRRKVPMLTIAPDLQRGKQLSYSSRLKMLAEEMATLSLDSGLGWTVYLDLNNKRWVFDVLEGVNRTRGQNINSPVTFSPEFNSLKSLSYTQSDLNYKNIAVVAGQGEGVERRIIEVGEEGKTGYWRREVFIDARDISETDDDGVQLPAEKVIAALKARGQQQLNELLQEEYLEGQMLNQGSFIYEKDFNNGDMVTIQNLNWGVTLDARITSVREAYENNTNIIEGTFGNNKPTLVQKIKQELSQISGEVRR
ncbi:phage minor structural protein, N- region [Lysinibacillus capsici]|uniref:Phage minor structural protein, N- region n=1 Tax=Lysinibacillus capsici TaxID=2115968 RepID=A0A2X0XHP0_9BACI|nr:siphovirus ReqiPepy6 Gp37-like family protein [Lysinibacillus capsici]SPT98439.1 phage minor structural protein, N- region [Lysinibacillus capsici]